MKRRQRLFRGANLNEIQIHTDEGGWSYLTTSRAGAGMNGPPVVVSMPLCCFTRGQLVQIAELIANAATVGRTRRSWQQRPPQQLVLRPKESSNGTDA